MQLAAEDCYSLALYLPTQRRHPRVKRIGESTFEITTKREQPSYMDSYKVYSFPHEPPLQKLHHPCRLTLALAPSPAVPWR